jgi:hypothetical protein
MNVGMPIESVGMTQRKEGFAQLLASLNKNTFTNAFRFETLKLNNFPIGWRYGINLKSEI